MYILNGLRLGQRKTLRDEEVSAKGGSTVLCSSQDNENNETIRNDNSDYKGQGEVSLNL